MVDRLVIDDKIRVRLGDSVETALRWGEGVMFTLHQLPEAAAKSSPRPKSTPADASAPPTRMDRNAALEQNVFARHRQKF